MGLISKNVLAVVCMVGLTAVSGCGAVIPNGDGFDATKNPPTIFGPAPKAVPRKPISVNGKSFPTRVLEPFNSNLKPTTQVNVHGNWVRCVGGNCADAVKDALQAEAQGGGGSC
ncbi:hypothetical protein [Pseudorhodobacter ferrugineus]|uniref:hypothetical protein n=1 Tax=Pseudorhodobacter ferrugineus TaxID=77008 RepID=UPI0003B6324C|nr:hypothetical protein [Pseudorhodobacter ferrugineus]